MHSKPNFLNKVVSEAAELRNFLIEDSIRTWLCDLNVSWLDWPYYAAHLRLRTSRDYVFGANPGAITIINYPNGTIELVVAQFEAYPERED